MKKLSKAFLLFYQIWRFSCFYCLSAKVYYIIEGSNSFQIQTNVVTFANSLNIPCCVKKIFYLQTSIIVIVVVVVVNVVIVIVIVIIIININIDIVIIIITIKLNMVNVAIKLALLPSFLINFIWVFLMNYDTFTTNTSR